MRDIARRVLPRSARHGLRDGWRGVRLRLAAARLLRTPHYQPVDAELLASFRSSWGNDAWTAPLEFLQLVADRARNTGGPILECGSGCSTLLLGLVAASRGVEVWSLEHDDQWRQRIMEALRRLGIAGVRVLHAPLRSYGAYDWYDPPVELPLPERFTVVVCDGPPNGSTRGGRYGLLPVLGRRFGPGTELLLDDASREEEAAVIQRWAAERRFRLDVDRAAGRGIAHLIVA